VGAFSSGSDERIFHLSFFNADFSLQPGPASYDPPLMTNEKSEMRNGISPDCDWFF
jgi:hypothetical protein